MPVHLPIHMSIHMSIHAGFDWDQFFNDFEYPDVGMNRSEIRVDDPEFFNGLAKLLKAHPAEYAHRHRQRHRQRQGYRQYSLQQPISTRVFQPLP